MSLFGKKSELPPDVGREDFVDAISGAEGDEMRYLRYSQDEVTYLEDYFDENIADDEPVLALASSCYPTASVSRGVIVATRSRIIAVIGSEPAKRGHPVEEPSFYEFPMAHVSVQTKPWGTGFLGTFQVTRQSPVQLQVSHDMSRGQRFFDTVNRQITLTL